MYLDAECDRLEIDYLLQPGGGSMELYDNDRRADEISTEGEVGPGFALTRFRRARTVSSWSLWIAPRPALRVGGQ